MRRFLSLLTTIAIALSLAACDKPTPTAPLNEALCPSFGSAWSIHKTPEVRTVFPPTEWCGSVFTATIDNGPRGGVTFEHRFAIAERSSVEIGAVVKNASCSTSSILFHVNEQINYMDNPFTRVLDPGPVTVFVVESDREDCRSEIEATLTVTAAPK